MIKQKKNKANIFLILQISLSETFLPHLNQAIIECQITPDQISSKVSWFKDGTRIEPSVDPKYSFIKHENGTAQLLIANPSDADSGKYTCQVKNDIGQEEQVYHSLDIRPAYVKKKIDHEKTRMVENAYDRRGRRNEYDIGYKLHPISLESHMRSMTIEKNGRAKFILSVLGPIKTIVWKKDNIPIDINNNHRYRSINHDGLISLEILNADRDDSGFYSCTVSGDRNEVTSNSMLTVYESTPRASRSVTSFSHDHHLPISRYSRPSRGIPLLQIIFCF